MKIEAFMIIGVLAICLIARAQAQENVIPSAANTDLPSSLSATLDWMAHTYFFTEADVLSSKLTIHSKQTDASLTHQGCRITLEQKDVIFDTAPAGRTDTSIWKRVIDLGRLDAKSIQLHS